MFLLLYYVPEIYHTFFIILVCNAGHHKNGDNCISCRGNTIKPSVGNDSTCPETCSGTSDVPNPGYTDCSKWKKVATVLLLLTNIHISQILTIQFCIFLFIKYKYVWHYSVSSKFTYET